jgi:hypothetical protein
MPTVRPSVDALVDSLICARQSRPPVSGTTRQIGQKILREYDHRRELFIQILAPHVLPYNQIVDTAVWIGMLQTENARCNLVGVDANLIPLQLDMLNAHLESQYRSAPSEVAALCQEALVNHRRSMAHPIPKPNIDTLNSLTRAAELRSVFSPTKVVRPKESIRIPVLDSEKHDVLSQVALDTLQNANLLGAKYRVEILVTRSERNLTVSRKSALVTATNDTECAICLDTAKIDMWRELPCLHTFHELCLAEWYKTKTGPGVCPCCRAETQYRVSSDDGYECTMHEFRPLSQLT